VDGDAERIHKMLLYLNVKQHHEAKQAHQALVRAAKRLTHEAMAECYAKAAGVELKDVVNLAFHEFFERRQYLPEAP
jgi:hypothetical protein